MTISELINELKKLETEHGEDTICTGEITVKPMLNTITLKDGSTIDCPVPNKHIIMH